MGLQIIGYDEDENPQYEWVDETSDYTYTPTQQDQEQPNTPMPGPNNYASDTGANIYPDGYGGYVDGQGNPVTIVKDETGQLVTSTGQVLPKTDALGNQFQESIAGGTPTIPTNLQTANLPGGSDFVNSVKGYFQKKDAQGNILKDAQGNPLYDWGKIIGAGTVAASLSNLNKPNITPSGYQGGIPSLTAIRSQIPNTYDPNRRPGSGGQRYFSDMAYVGTGDAAGQQAAQQRIAQGAADIVAQNKANPANQPVNRITRTAPASSGMMGFGGVPVENQPMNNSGIGSLPVVKAAKGKYLRGSTDGMADELDTSIDDTQPAKLSHGEFVVPADVVSHLGNGNSEAGAKKLYQMMDKVRQARTGTKKQGKKINPDKFMPGGIAGETKKFVVGGATGTGAGLGSAVSSGVTGTESNLSNWAGPYVTNMLGQGQALGAKPYEAYQGPLTAGASDLQQQAFQTGINLNIPTQSMGGYAPQTFGTQQAQQYMNPYLQSALEPQLAEQRRQAQINLQPNLAKMAQAGGLGGGRQAIMQAEANRNLQTQQNQTIGTGYLDAYNKAMQQFNTEQGLGLQAQNLTNQYGLGALQQQAALGAQQRGIESEGITADIAQFEQEKLDPYKKLQFQQSLLQGLPVQAQQYNVAGQNTLQQILGALSDTQGAPAIVKSLQSLGIIPTS